MAPGRASCVPASIAGNARRPLGLVDDRPRARVRVWTACIIGRAPARANGANEPARACGATVSSQSSTDAALAHDVLSREA